MLIYSGELTTRREWVRKFNQNHGANGRFAASNASSPGVMPVGSVAAKILRTNALVPSPLYPTESRENPQGARVRENATLASRHAVYANVSQAHDEAAAAHREAFDVYRSQGDTAHATYHAEQAQHHELESVRLKRYGR